MKKLRNTQRKKPRVYVGGTFDLFHPGHVELLRQAWTLGDVTVVLNSDDYVEEFKGKRPTMHFMERAHMLLSCEFVDEVLYNPGEERYILDKVKPDYILYAIQGDEYDRESYLERLQIDEEYLAKNNIELIFSEYTEGVSSSDIINRILQCHCGKSCESCRSAEDAGEPDVSDPEAGPGRCTCVGDGDRCTCRPQGRLSGHYVPCS